MEQREDDGRHETRLSENIHNLNRGNAYGVFDSHSGCEAGLGTGACVTLDRQQREQRSELLLELTAASFWLLDLPSVERLASEALDLAEQVHRSDLAANAMGWLAHARSGHGDLVGAIEMNSAAIVRAGGARTVAYAMHPLNLYLAGRAIDGIECGVQAAGMARASRDTTFTMYALSHYGLSLGGVGTIYRGGRDLR